MGFWSKLGQTALRAAPYVAAPFTGGASLTMAGPANQAADMWAQKNANDQYKKTGIAPSPSAFDRFASMAGNMAGQYAAPAMSAKYGGAGMDDSRQIGPSPGGRYGTPPFVPSQGGGGMGPSQGGMAQIIQQIMAMRGQGGGQPNLGSNQGMGPNVMNFGGGGGQAVGRMDQSNPNLAYALQRGKNQAIRNQPFRMGDTMVTGEGEDGGPPTTAQLPPIYPNQGNRGGRGVGPSNYGMGMGGGGIMPRNRRPQFEMNQ